jgi:hypothetical protein
MHVIAHSLATVVSFLVHIGHGVATTATAFLDSISGGGPT